MGKKIHLSKKKAGGLTLVELIIVLAILAVLAAIAIPQYFRYLDSARVTVSISVLDSLRKELAVYNLQYSAYPATINFVDFTDQDGRPILTALSQEYMHAKIQSWDRYVISGGTYTITATATDSRHTVLTLTPEGATR